MRGVPVRAMAACVGNRGCKDVMTLVGRGTQVVCRGGASSHYLRGKIKECLRMQNGEVAKTGGLQMAGRESTEFTEACARAGSNRKVHPARPWRQIRGRSRRYRRGVTGTLES